MAGLRLLGWLVPEILRNKHSSPWWPRVEPSDRIGLATLQFRELRRDVSLSYLLVLRTNFVFHKTDSKGLT